jgi:hypothetical protein
VFPTPRPPTVGDSRTNGAGPPLKPFIFAVLLTASGVAASQAGRWRR